MTTTTTVEQQDEDICGPFLQQVEELIELVNIRWKVNRIESHNYSYPELSYILDKKYIKVMYNTAYALSPYRTLEEQNIPPKSHFSHNVFMFVDKKTGECYESASYEEPAKGVRCMITELLKDPEMVDPYSDFLYLN